VKIAIYFFLSPDWSQLSVCCSVLPLASLLYASRSPNQRSGNFGLCRNFKLKERNTAFPKRHWNFFFKSSRYLRIP